MAASFWWASWTNGRVSSNSMPSTCGVSSHLECNRELVVVAVGKWESRSDSQARTASVFSTAWARTHFPLLRRQVPFLLGRLRAVPPVGHLVDTLDLALNHFPQLKRIQRRPQFLQCRYLLGVGRSRGHH